MIEQWVKLRRGATMPKGEDVPIIRDMVMQCKCCGNCGFPDSFTKQGLCSICAKGKAEQKPPERDIYDEYDFPTL